MNGKTLVALAILVTCLAAAAGAADDKPAFFIEGVSDPEHLARQPGANRPERLDEMVRQQAMTDALVHLSAYGQGQPFAFNVANLNAPFRVADTGYQSPRGARPVTSDYRVLRSQALLGRFGYAAEDLPLLNLREDLADLPTYRVIGEFDNRSLPLTRVRLHWLAAKDAYLSAMMAHVAKVHGNKEIRRATGRVFPVQVI